MTLLIICTAKAYQELHIITILKFFSIVNIMSDRVKIYQFSCSPFALKDFFKYFKRSRIIKHSVMFEN